MIKIGGAVDTYDGYARTSLPVTSVSARADATVTSSEYYARVGLISATELGCMDNAAHSSSCSGTTGSYAAWLIRTYTENKRRTMYYGTGASVWSESDCIGA